MVRKNLAEAAESMKRFLGSGLVKLGDKLGPINWQLDPSKQFDAKEIAAFLDLLPPRLDGRPLRHAIEARHESFDCKEFITLAGNHDVAIVEAGDSEHPRIQARTASSLIRQPCSLVWVPISSPA